MRKVLLLANPISGNGRNRRRCEELTHALAKLRIEAETKFTERRGHAIQLADAAADHYETVVAVGGDGTLREVSEGLRGRAPAAVFPTGTANVVARELNLPFHAEGVARVLQQRRVARIDTAICNGRRTLFVVGVGLDAQILIELEKARRGGISYMSYLRPIVTSLRNHSPAALQVSVDGGAAHDCGFVIISNTRYYAGPWIRFKKGPVMEDGLFEVYSFRSRSAAGIAASLALGVAGGLPGGNIIFTKGRNIIIHADAPTPYQIDGDSAGYTPVAIEVERKSLPMVVAGHSPVS